MDMPVDIPDAPSPAALPACHHCQAPSLRLIAGYEALWRVSSDCLPVEPGGQLAQCNQCGATQKPLTRDWQQQVDRIYRDYRIYHQTGQHEQVVFDPRTGQAASRSTALLDQLLPHLNLTDQGFHLDVGCGNGAMLRAMGALRPNWTLAGHELDQQHEEAVLRLPGVKAFHHGPVDRLTGQYDFITLLHVLEHVPSPASFLTALADRLDPAVGRLLIQVPDTQANPFDLLIADHSTHFDLTMLGRTLTQAGWKPAVLRNDLLPRELTALAFPGHASSGENDAGMSSPIALEGKAGRPAPSAQVRWLASVAQGAIDAAQAGPIAVFGTSIAGTWLGATLADAQADIACFVDEDALRHGRTFMGRPIVAPARLPAGVRLLVPLAPAVRQNVVNRLEQQGIAVVAQPELDV